MPTDAAKRISVLLVDDHSLVRRGFRRMLEDEADMTVVGEAGDGEEAIRLARELKPQVIVMDKGYILKNAMNLELGPAVRRVAEGKTIFDPQVEYGEALKGERSSGLTPRELEVLQMIVDGKSNKEIATALDLSANTIAVHRANIMNALGIHKTAELVVYAIRSGLVNVP